MGMASIKQLPSTEELREMFDYNHETGLLFWKTIPPRAKQKLLGSPAGYQLPRGYMRVKIDGINYPAHRVIWKFVTGSDPVDLIDHKNGDPSDNRFCNLREATVSQNTMNAKLSGHNRSGIKGVKFVKADNAWGAYIGLNGKQHHLGQFKSFEMAVAVRRAAEKQLHGEYARGA